MEFTLERNIRLIVAIRTLKMFMVAMPVIVIFWKDLGFTFTDIFLLQGIFSVTAMITEIPSGYFADTFTRRLSIILGLMLASVAWVVYAGSYEFWQFAAGEILLGISFSAISGADTAILYDSLSALGREDEFLKYNSRSFGFAFGGEAVAGVIGGLLAIGSLRYPLYGQIVPAMIAIPLGFKLVEPELRRRQDTENPIRAIGRVVKHALHENTGVKWLILLHAALSTMTYTFVWLAQPYYELAGVAIGLFGFLSLMKHGFLSLFSWKAETIVNRFGADWLLMSLPVIGVATYLTLSIGFNYWLIGSLIGFEFIRGIARPVISAKIHSLIESDFRATVESVNGFVVRLFFTIFGIGVGVFSDRYGLRATFLVSAAVYGAMIALILLAMHRRSILKFNRR